MGLGYRDPFVSATRDSLGSAQHSLKSLSIDGPRKAFGVYNFYNF